MKTAVLIYPKNYAIIPFKLFWTIWHDSVKQPNLFYVSTDVMFTKCYIKSKHDTHTYTHCDAPYMNQTLVMRDWTRPLELPDFELNNSVWFTVNWLRNILRFILNPEKYFLTSFLHNEPLHSQPQHYEHCICKPRPKRKRKSTVIREGLLLSWLITKWCGVSTVNEILLRIISLLNSRDHHTTCQTNVSSLNGRATIFNVIA